MCSFITKGKVFEKREKLQFKRKRSIIKAKRRAEELSVRMCSEITMYLG